MRALRTVGGWAALIWLGGSISLGLALPPRGIPAVGLASFALLMGTAVWLRRKRRLTVWTGATLLLAAINAQTTLALLLAGASPAHVAFQAVVAAAFVMLLVAQMTGRIGGIGWRDGRLTVESVYLPRLAATSGGTDPPEGERGAVRRVRATVAPGVRTALYAGMQLFVGVLWVLMVLQWPSDRWQVERYSLTVALAAGGGVLALGAALIGTRIGLGMMEEIWLRDR